MRGDKLTRQPYVVEDEENTFVLCWNGEIYSYNFSLSEDDLGVDLPKYDAAEEQDSYRSDTKDVMIILSQVVRSTAARNGREEQYQENIAKALSFVQGEYSLIFYHKPKNKESSEPRIYFGRDPLGRRSLLISDDAFSSSPPSQTSNLILTSVAFDLRNQHGQESKQTNIKFKEVEAGKIFSIDISSGALTDTSLQRPELLSDPIVPHDLKYALSLSEEGVSGSMVRASETLHSLLSLAVRRRVMNAPLPDLSNGSDVPDPNPASVGVLFSGGIDSVVLAALCHEHVPLDRPIDLINVAFSSQKIAIASSPDRLAALLSFKEMVSRFQTRRWRFIAVDVPYEEVLLNERRICRLISPLASTMDFNIATAMWFASRARGKELKLCHTPKRMEQQAQRSNEGDLLRFAGKQCNQADAMGSFDAEELPYCSQARVLLVGIGADEQLGGYGRHRSVFNKGGYEALKNELKMERERLWTRNLGRDDRVISDHGKEARFPFLDEDVVSFLQSLDVLDMVDMDRAQGEGDKMILRLLARKLGVVTCSTLVKRAIQFGTRIAKCSDVDRFGSSRKASGNMRHRQSVGSTQ